MMKETKYDRWGMPISVNGMSAYNSHRPMTKETAKRLKKNGSLAQYQAEHKKYTPTDADEERVSKAFRNLLNN